MRWQISIEIGCEREPKAPTSGRQVMNACQIQVGYRNRAARFSLHVNLTRSYWSPRRRSANEVSLLSGLVVAEREIISLVCTRAEAKFNQCALCPLNLQPSAFLNPYYLPYVFPFVRGHWISSQRSSPTLKSNTLFLLLLTRLASGT